MTTPADSISQAIRAAHGAGRTALVAFLTAGFPEKARFTETLLAVAEAADVVEIGVPFTDPMADGMTIQRASRAALAQGVSMQWILDTVGALPRRPAAPLLLMSYLNPLLAYGLDKLPAAARAAGISGFIVPDLPHEEAADLETALAGEGLALIQMVTPVTPQARLENLCAAAKGFVYAVTMTGTTGKNVAVPEEVTSYLDRVRAASSVPVCAGFGIRAKEQVDRLAAHVEGVVVGSALVEVLERGENPAAFLGALR